MLKQTLRSTDEFTTDLQSAFAVDFQHRNMYMYTYHGTRNDIVYDAILLD